MKEYCLGYAGILGRYLLGEGESLEDAKVRHSFAPRKEGLEFLATEILGKIDPKRGHVNLVYGPEIEPALVQQLREESSQTHPKVTLRPSGKQRFDNSH